MQDLTRIEEKLDVVAAGSIPISGEAGGMEISQTTQAMDLAKLMALSRTAVPPHLRGNAGGCLAIVLLAREWKLSPFAVANKSYEVNNRIGYEAQLIHAVIERRANLKQRLRFTFEGEGATLRCTCIGHFNGELEPLEYRTPPLGEIKTKNSPLWQSDPEQQLSYFAVRSWGRRYCPDIVLGIYTTDELREAEVGPENARDVTPSPARPGLAERLKASSVKKQRGFSPAHVEREIGLKPTPVQQKSTEPAKAESPVGDPSFVVWIDSMIEQANGAESMASLDELDDRACAACSRENREDQRKRWNVAYSENAARFKKSVGEKNA